MALRFAESGGQYHQSNLMGPGIWAASSGGTIGNTAPARNGSTWGYNGNNQWTTPSFGNQSGLVVGGATFLTTLSGTPILFTLLRSGAGQCDVRFDASGHIIVTRAGTVLGTSTLTLSTGSWHFIEFKAILSITATGSCEVVVDGTTFLTLAGVQNATTAAVADQVQYQVSNATNTWWRDFYVLDTTSGSNTNYLGDITVAEVYPNGAGVNAAWSVQQGAFVLTAAANASGGTTVYTGTITNGASPANAWQGYYFNVTAFLTGANNGGPWLCTASTATTITLQNPSGVAETHAGSCAFQNPVQAGIHGGDIDGAATTNVGTRPPGDNQFLFDSTANDKTDYAHQTLALTGSIPGVVHVTYARKDDAGARQMAQLCESTGTEETSPTITLTGNYSYYSDILEIDPHTSALWTLAGYNAATFGFKEIT
jgi:hypothetical protein